MNLADQLNEWCDAAGIPGGKRRQSNLRKKLAERGVQRTRAAVWRWFTDGDSAGRPDDEAIAALVAELALDVEGELRLRKMPVGRSPADANAA